MGRRIKEVSVCDGCGRTGLLGRVEPFPDGGLEEADDGALG